MNNNIKIHLTIEMESGALVRKSIGQEYSVNPAAIEDIKRNTSMVCEPPSKFVHRNLVNKPSFKVVQLGESAYNWFRSYESRPDLRAFYAYRKEWGRYTPDERLEKWLNIICCEAGGKSFTYEVFED